jgi:hypothetical protein
VGKRFGFANDSLMTAMQAVEITERNDTSFEGCGNIIDVANKAHKRSS